MSADGQPVVLIVDDDAVQRTLLNEALSLAGFVCDEAVDGEEGLEKCLTTEPDLIVLDVIMPGRDGFSVCSEIRKGSKAQRVPILMVTGLDDMGSIERAFDVGATNFLTKPINLDLVAHHIKYMLRSSQWERDISAAKRLAEESSAAKSQFLANMSHELRTPLNAIIGFSEMIRNEVMGSVGNSSYKDYAGDIHHSGVHLLKIINDVLDVSKIESGAFDATDDHCFLPDLLESVVRLVLPRAREAEISIDVEIAESLSLVCTDELRLKQVLLNLLSNSVKFTQEKGKVELEASVSEAGDLVITVADNGIGIPADQMSKAMSLFGQVDGGLARKFEGTGLGLPLSKLITENLGGVFLLESHENRGTKAILTFPGDRVFRLEGQGSEKIAS